MAPSFLFSLAEHLVFIVYFSTFCTAQPILWQVLGLQNISWSQLPVHTCPTLPQLTFIFSPGLPQQPPVLSPGLPACSLQVSLHKAAVSCYSPVGSANTRYKIVENLKYRNLKLKGKKIKKFFKEKNVKLSLSLSCPPAHPVPFSRSSFLLFLPESSSDFTNILISFHTDCRIPHTSQKALLCILLFKKDLLKIKIRSDYSCLKLSIA